MSRPVQNVFELFVGIWPRIITYSNMPSLLALALVANLIALFPDALRMPKEGVAGAYRTPAFEQSTQAEKGKQQ